MDERLAEHFGLTDTGSDEPSDWREITPEHVIEGVLWEDPNWPNRMRLVRIDPERGPLYEFEIHAHGDRVRVRLPFRLSALPDPIVEANEWHYEQTGEFGAHGQPLERQVIDSARKRWFEQVGDETHLLIEVLP